MTSVQPVSESTDVVNWKANSTGLEGLEDFDQSDISMPRLQIDHADGVFKHSQTEETFDELTVIILGLHKGRLMWPAEIGEGESKDSPLCKSPDFRHGFPNLSTEVPRDKRFPWEAQDRFTTADLKPIEVEVLGVPMLTEPSLPCEKCKFREWNTDPSGKRPWCAEEWTLPLLYMEGEGDDAVWSPALFSVRRSGVKPTKTYLTPFVTRKTNTFTAVTKLGLDKFRRGSVKYCTPTYEKVGITDEADHPDYYESFRSAKEFLKQYPLPRDEDSNESDDPNLNNEVVENNTIDADVVEEPQPAQPQAQAQPEPEPEKEKVFSTKGRVKQPEPVAPTASAGTSTYDDDDEPPF
ncbi:hypothetical protein SEA_BENCZKOWSKI14_59 [Gordonia phage Benczkowski14]|uniref:Uncharacterized protein n=2 Tax=Demosthenesvirus katyusha TaxID=1982108 RepID=A0A142KCD6_9CAUD|nr:hypothetical protein FDH67_gp59 [Gordonia phage Katyusha]AMS03452.1 hypothetical protein SEA_KATYUSHA_59 [Gordonia phage Katyusha]AMS03769.1 hypothetical protein SEA_BENCZKOWSKI14_59 [Gordonia phage Benczkowski14]